MHQHTHQMKQTQVTSLSEQIKLKNKVYTRPTPVVKR